MKNRKVLMRRALPQKSISVVRVSCLVRVTSWLVLLSRKLRTIHEVTLTNTNQNTPAWLDPTFEAKLMQS